MQLKKCYSLLLTLLLLCGCALPRSINFDKKLFNENYNKWKSLNIENYKFTYSSIGFSSYSVKIEVKDGEASSFNADDNYPFNNETLKNEGRTIDAYFKEIINFYNKHNNREYTDQEMYYTDIIVKYNQDYGFPEEWHYRYYCPENLEVDGNFSSRISDFEVNK